MNILIQMLNFHICMNQELFQVTRGQLTWIHQVYCKTHRKGNSVQKGPLYTFQYRWMKCKNEKGKKCSQAGKGETSSSGWREGTAGPRCSLCARAAVFVMGKASCFQAVIRQPWGSVKTWFPFHLNCCTHPANWNLATGSLALSLKCCQVTEMRECGIMAASDARVLPPSLF